MNWDQIVGKWKQFKGAAQVKWGKLTDDEWDEIAGERERLAGLLQEHYGKTKNEVNREIDEWAARLKV